MARNAFLRIEFAVTPRFDVFYALYALTSTAQTPLENWKERAVRRLPRNFERVARRIAPLPIFWPLLADAIQSTPGEVSFDEMLSTIREMRVEDLKRNVLSGIFHERETVDALVTRKKALDDLVADEALPGAELLTHFGLKPYDADSAAARALNALLTRPQSYRDELGLVLQRFWETGFRADWSALEPSLRAESFRMRDLGEEAQPGGLARELNLPVTFDDAARQIQPKTGSAIAYDRVDRCYIIPSAFNAKRLWTKYEASSGRVTVYLPIARDINLTDLRFPVQYVIRPNLDFRGFAGTLASGVVRRGDTITVLPSAGESLAPVHDVQRADVRQVGPRVARGRTERREIERRRRERVEIDLERADVDRPCPRDVDDRFGCERS